MVEKVDSSSKELRFECEPSNSIHRVQSKIPIYLSNEILYSVHKYIHFIRFGVRVLVFFFLYPA